MSRPEKDGIEYFYLECDPDDKLNYIEARYHLEGWAVVLKLWRKIYKYHGYWCEWDEKSQYIFSKENNIPIDKLQEIIQTCFDERLFNKGLYDKHKILTSSGVQKFWRKVVVKARRKNQFIRSDYYLLGHSTPENEVSTPENEVSTPEPSAKVHKVKVKVKDKDIDKSISSDGDLDFKGELSEKPEKPIQEKKKTGAAPPKKEPNPETELFHKFKNLYVAWYKTREGQPPKLDGGGYAAVKSLVGYFRAVAKDEFNGQEMTDEQIDSRAFDWMSRVLVHDWDKMQDDFLKRTDIKNINSQINNILSHQKQISDGTYKKSFSGNGQKLGTSDARELAARNYGLANTIKPSPGTK